MRYRVTLMLRSVAPAAQRLLRRPRAGTPALRARRSHPAGCRWHAVRLGELWESGPAVVVFLRVTTAASFCREHVAQLRDHEAHSGMPARGSRPSASGPHLCAGSRGDRHPLPALVDEQRAPTGSPGCARRRCSISTARTRGARPRTRGATASIAGKHPSSSAQLRFVRGTSNRFAHVSGTFGENASPAHLPAALDDQTRASVRRRRRRPTTRRGEPPQAIGLPGIRFPESRARRRSTPERTAGPVRPHRSRAGPAGRLSSASFLAACERRARDRVPPTAGAPTSSPTRAREWCGRPVPAGAIRRPGAGR